MKNTCLVAVRGDSVVRILEIVKRLPDGCRKALCVREDGDRTFWAKIHKGKHENDYIMSKGHRHYLCKQEVRK